MPKLSYQKEITENEIGLHRSNELQFHLKDFKDLLNYIKI